MQLKLVAGQGSLESGTGCWMSMLGWITGQKKWTDKVECVDPLIRELCIRANDWLSDEARERVIAPHLFAPLGTLRSRKVMQDRSESEGGPRKVPIKIFGNTIERSWDDYVIRAANAIVDRVLERSDLVPSKIECLPLHDGTSVEIGRFYHQNDLDKIVEHHLIPAILRMCAIGGRSPVKEVRDCPTLSCPVGA